MTGSGFTELAFFSEHDLVQLANGVGRVVENAVVTDRGKEEPHQGQVEGEGEGQDLANPR